MEKHNEGQGLKLWGRAKQDVLVNSQAICDRLKKGESLFSIYKDLKAQGLVQSAHKNFSYHVKKLLLSTESSSSSVFSKNNPTVAVSSSVAPEPQSEASPSGMRKFKFDPKYKPLDGTPVSASLPPKPERKNNER